MTVTEITCSACGVLTLKQSKFVNYAFKNNIRLYCSVACSNLSKITSVNLPCNTCGKPTRRVISQLDKSKSGKVYCSRSCAASVNNITPKRSKITAHCINCGSLCKSNARQYCSQECQNHYSYINYITEWKSGTVSGNQEGTTGNVSSRVIQFMRIKYENQCARCGWQEINETTGTVPLQCHHIDGDRQNTVEKNLIMLCPNCHSLTDSYCGLNVRRNKQPSVAKPGMAHALGA